MWKPILLTIVSGVFLTGGAGYGFLSTCGDMGSGPKPGNQLFAHLVLLGLAIFVGGFVWAFVAFAWSLFRSTDED